MIHINFIIPIWLLISIFYIILGFITGFIYYKQKTKDFLSYKKVLKDNFNLNLIIILISILLGIFWPITVIYSWLFLLCVRHNKKVRRITGLVLLILLILTLFLFSGALMNCDIKDIDFFEFWPSLMWGSVLMTGLTLLFIIISGIISLIDDY